MPTDKEIIEGLKHRDAKSFSDFVDAYGALIKSIVNYHLYDFKDLCEECINDVLLAVWNNVESFNPDKNTFKNWVGAISKYKTIDYKRKYRREKSFSELSESTPDTRDYFKNAEEEINSILSCLSPNDRELFYRHYILGEKVEKIAKNSGKSSAFLFNRLSRGRKKLRKTLKEEDFQ